MNTVINVIEQQQLGQIIINETMKNHTSIRTGGKVACLYMPKSIDALRTVIELLQEQDVEYKVIGRGSNIIFPDTDSNLFIIKINNVINEMECDECLVKVGAGYSLQTLAKVLSKKGYSGLEFAGGIPGTVGGAVFMNAGAHSGEMSMIVTEVTTLKTDGSLVTYTNEQCEFTYRHSIFQTNDEIIVGVTLKLEQDDPAATFKKMSGNLAYRQEMQPLDQPSFGSSFKNPVGMHAGKLIEEAGLKGVRLGGAQVSEKHANFIVNTGTATSEDVLNLINHVQSRISEHHGVDLKTEVEIVSGVSNEIQEK